MTDIWRVGVFLLLVVAILPALNTAHADHSLSQTNVTGESIVVDYTEPVPVAVDAPEYSESVTIDDDEGTPITEGEDYEWNSTSGEVTWLNSSATKDGEEMFIDYAYWDRSDTTEIAVGVLGPWGIVLALLLVFVVVYGGYRFAVGSGTGGGL